MISKSLIGRVKKYVYNEIEKYGVPSKFQVDYTNEVGQYLASSLKADENIVLLGTLLMDCQLGLAISRGMGGDHIEMSALKAKEILEVDNKIDSDEVKKVIECIEKHHGAKVFKSLESEICCNADCYRFISPKGFLGTIYYWEEKMELNKFMKIMFEKVEEKWRLLSIRSCINELRPMYKIIASLSKIYKFSVLK